MPGMNGCLNGVFDSSHTLHDHQEKTTPSLFILFFFLLLRANFAAQLWVYTRSVSPLSKIAIYSSTLRTHRTTCISTKKHHTDTIYRQQPGDDSVCSLLFALVRWIARKCFLRKTLFFAKQSKRQRRRKRKNLLPPRHSRCMHCWWMSSNRGSSSGKIWVKSASVSTVRLL